MSCLVCALYDLDTTNLKIDPVAHLHIDYIHTEYCLYRDFHFLIPSRDDWQPSTIVPTELLDIIYRNGGVFSGKQDLKFTTVGLL